MKVSKEDVLLIFDAIDREFLSCEDQDKVEMALDRLCQKALDIDLHEALLPRYDWKPPKIKSSTLEKWVCGDLQKQKKKRGK